MKKLLVATDGSRAADIAVAWAADLASAVGAKVVVAAGVEEAAELVGVAPGRGRATVLRAADAWAAPLHDRGVDHEVTVLRGDLRTALDEVAAGGDVDAVVVAGGRDAGLHHLAAHLPCPLIAVPAAGGAVRGGTVVAGVDGSPANEPVLRWATALAAETQGSATAAHVYSPLSDVMTHRASNWQYPWEPKVRAEIARYATDDADVDTVLAAGDPVDELIRIARERDASMIVVGRRGLGSMHGLILGSVPRRLLDHADRPVVVVPH